MRRKNNKKDIANWYYQNIWDRGFEAANKIRDFKENPNLRSDFWDMSVDGKKVLVSPEDYLWAMRYGWNINQGGYVWRNDYQDKHPTSHFGKFLHVEIFARKSNKNYKEFNKIDGWRGSIAFKNGNKLDCRRENLEWIYTGESLIKGKMRNTNTSGIIGVCFDKSRNKWIAQIQYKKKHYQKRFTKQDEAVRWRNLMEEKLIEEGRLDF